MIGAKTLVNGREVQIYNVHLLAFFMLGMSSTMFPWQRDLVADRLAASDLPTILGGDFNVSQDDPIVEQFAEHGYATVQHKVPTWRRQPFVLDHIFYNSGLRVRRAFRGGLDRVGPPAAGRRLRPRRVAARAGRRRPRPSGLAPRTGPSRHSRSSSRRARSDAICLRIFSTSSASAPDRACSRRCLRKISRSAIRPWNTRSTSASLARFSGVRARDDCGSDLDRRSIASS